jgi:hypothetical protein
VNPSSHVAELASIQTQLDELRKRLADMAESYRDQPEVSAATDLFNAERQLIAATRSVERAAAELRKIAVRSS